MKRKDFLNHIDNIQKALKIANSGIDNDIEIALARNWDLATVLEKQKALTASTDSLFALLKAFKNKVED